MTHRTIWAVVFSLGTLVFLPGFGHADGEGTAAAGFLKLGVGARAVALGEAYTAMADEATALYWNPGALRRVPKRSATLMHAAYVDSSSFDYGAYAQRVGPGAIGVGVQYLSAGKITQRDTSGVETGDATPNDVAVSVGYAHPVGNWSAGIAAKVVRSQIVDSAQTVAGDVGLLSPGFLNERVRLAFTASHVGGKLKFDQKADKLPAVYKVGSAWRLFKPLTLGLDVAMPEDNDTYVAAGLEYGQPLGKSFSTVLRAGYNSRTSGDLDGMSGVSFGMGFGFTRMSVDYGFLPVGSLGAAHRISVSYGF